MKKIAYKIGYAFALLIFVIGICYIYNIQNLFKFSWCLDCGQSIGQLSHTYCFGLKLKNNVLFKLGCKTSYLQIVK